MDNVLVYQDGSEKSKSIVMVGGRLGGLGLSSQEDFGVSNGAEPSGFTLTEH